MGLISAAVSSVSGVLSDSWKEVIEPDDMSDSTLLVKGVAVKRGSNKKGTDNYVSNGSVIHVYPNTLMLLMDGGKIVDYSAQEGYYEVNNSSAPSIFNGELKDSVKETWKRFQFGGVPSQKQYVYYINTAEIISTMRSFSSVLTVHTPSRSLTLSSSLPNLLPRALTGSR